ncbi:Type II secretory pathway component [Operophtera brumata]|uniref:Type II secretory pathway component n=1 Tax=Operophtera brumata TaxID=104452 RepID=A0A0L7LGA4_OPEBR|nr:Type II secretory pathway component [Operophtera brumata]
MGCTPSMLLDRKNRRRDSTGSQEAALAKATPTTVCNKAVQAARAPRASLESDGFSIQLSSKKDSYCPDTSFGRPIFPIVPWVGNLYARQVAQQDTNSATEECIPGQ